MSRAVLKLEFLVASGLSEPGAGMAMLAAGHFTVGSVLEEQAAAIRNAGTACPGIWRGCRRRRSCRPPEVAVTLSSEAGWQPVAGVEGVVDIDALRYALTLAEELHFGRSARRHYISEAQFGRRIRALEAELGIRIFERTSRRVWLTPEGVDMVAGARRVLGELADLRPARRTPDPGARPHAVRVGVLGFGIGDRWSRLRNLVMATVPDVELVHRPLTLANQYLALHRGEVDVALVHYLGEVGGVELVPVMVTPRVAVVPSSSSLARAARISVDDVRAQDWLRVDGGDDRFADWVGAPSAGRVAATIDTVTTAVATTGLVGFHGAAAAEFFAHPDVRFVPLEGAPVTTAVATRADDDRPEVIAFRIAAARVAQLPQTG